MIKDKINKNTLIAWVIMMIVVTIDMITTVEGIKLGAEEVSPLPAFFFSFGDIGYIIAWIFEATVIFFVLLYTVKLCSWIYEKIEKKKMGEKFKTFLYYFFAGVFSLLELLVILHNIKIISSLG